MKIKILILALVLALCLGVVGTSLANNGVEMPRWVLSSGATDSAVDDVTLRATLGQPVVGQTSSGDVTVSQGYWTPEGEVEFNMYLPVMQR